MSTAEIIATVISAVSVAVAILSTVVAWRAMSVNRQLSMSAIRLNETVFLRQYWDYVEAINPTQQPPNIHAIVKAANALDLTASLWNHAGIEKEILYESYWDSYRRLYESLSSMNTAISEIESSPRDLLTQPITAAYDGMQRFGISKVQRTRLIPKKSAGGQNGRDSI